MKPSEIIICILILVALFFSYSLYRQVSAGQNEKNNVIQVVTNPTLPKINSPNLSRQFQKGMALGLYGDKPGFTLLDMIKEIPKLGATHISLILSWAQKDVFATEIAPEPNKAPYKDEQIARFIQVSHECGLKVFLFPILHVKERGDKEWRGTLKPKDRDEWWKNYNRFILHYAEMAEKFSVEILCIGSELVAMEGERERWAALIHSVRQVYKGKILYSANWDHFKPVVFWDLVDYIGMTAYYELTKSKEPTIEQLIAKWESIRDELRSWQKAIGKPIIFTEVGYPSQDGCNIYPWDYTTDEPIDLTEQYLCYLAFFRVWSVEKMLGGVYFWNWYGFGGPNDGYYTPRGKPAELVIKAWYGVEQMMTPVSN